MDIKTLLNRGGFFFCADHVDIGNYVLAVGNLIRRLKTGRDSYQASFMGSFSQLSKARFCLKD